MRNLLALLALLVLSFLGVGGWRGWYGIDSQPSSPGRIAFRVEIDTVKIGSDLAEGWRKVTGSADKESGATKPESTP